MNPVLQTLALVAGSLLLAAALRSWLPAGEGVTPRPTLLGEKLEALALKLLLPLFVYEAISRGSALPQLLLAAGVGFMLPPLCIAVYAMLRRLPVVARFGHAPEIGFLAASFGGGNRGTALLVVLMAGAPDFASQLQWFALVDLGNFIFMLVLTPVLLARYYGAREQGAHARWKTWAGSYLAATVAVVVLCCVLALVWGGFEGLLAASAPWRKAAFTVLVFTALGLRFKAGKASALGQGLLLFGAIRALAAIAVLGLVLVDAAKPLLLPLGILLLMPPSSILPSLIARTGVAAGPLGYASSFATAVNVLYLPVLALAGLIALWR